MIKAEEERKATAKAQAEAEAILAAERAKQATEEAARHQEAIAKAKAENDAAMDAMVAKKRAEIEAKQKRVDAEMEALKPAIEAWTKIWAGVDVQALRVDRQNKGGVGCFWRSGDKLNSVAQRMS